MDALFKRTKESLAAAREHFGYDNQILVCVEELNELSCLLTKYPRYDGSHQEAVDSLRDRVLEECGDVFNALDHIQAIFGISDNEIIEAAAKKGDRLLKWLKASGMKITMEDREVPNSPCPMCMYNGADPFALPCFICKTKPEYKGFTPKK